MSLQSSDKAFIFLGICMVFSSYLISSAIHDVNFSSNVNTTDISNAIDQVASSLAQESPKGQKEMLSEKEAEEYLGISEYTLHLLKNETDIPYIQTDLTTFYSTDALDQWLLNSGRKYNVQTK